MFSLGNQLKYQYNELIFLWLPKFSIVLTRSWLSSILICFCLSVQWTQDFEEEACKDYNSWGSTVSIIFSIVVISSAKYILYWLPFIFLFFFLFIRKQRNIILLQDPKKFLLDFRLPASHLFWNLFRLMIAKLLINMDWVLFCCLKSVLFLTSSSSG